MKLYRVVHKSLIEGIGNRPQSGALVDGENVYMVAYDSFAMVVLEHPFYKLVLGFPRTFYVVTYNLPDISGTLIREESVSLYKENFLGNRKFGRWVNGFIQSKTALVTEFPSLNWTGQTNYLINVRHPVFDDVQVVDISPVR